MREEDIAMKFGVESGGIVEDSLVWFSIHLGSATLAAGVISECIDDAAGDK